MKRRIWKNIAVIMSAGGLALSGCKEDETSHVHQFNQKNTAEQYLKSEKNCASPAFYDYTCSFGETGEETVFYLESCGD